MFIDHLLLPGTGLETAYTLSDLPKPNVVNSHYQQPHFTDGETKFWGMK